MVDGLQRVMPERWFVLMRCWMRIDGGLIRSAETRVFHEMGTDTVLRMHTIKEAQSKDLQQVRRSSARLAV